MLAGVPHATVSRAESGSHTPRLQTFVALLGALGYRLTAVSSTGQSLELDAEHDAVADAAGRHFPAHLQWGPTPEDGEGQGWWGWYRIAWPFVRQQVPVHTYWRRSSSSGHGELSDLQGRMTGMTESRVTVPGSSRPAVPTSGPLDPGTEIEVTIALRRRTQIPDEAFTGPPLTRDELGARYGADPDELESVVSTVRAAGAEVVSSDAANRLVRVRGTAGVLGELFGTELAQAEGPGTRARSGELSVPESMGNGVVGVFGLDDRPQSEVRFSRATSAAGSVSYTPLELASAYGLPAADGAGQTVAIIELGGGFGQSDLDTYFSGLKLTTPKVTAVGVDGGSNQAGQDPSGADGEVLLDIEVVGAIAPSASIVVYFAPNTDAGFLDAITQAAHAIPTPTAMSISWGQSEDQWTAQARTAMDSAFADAALLGVTVTVAAGDNGSADNQPANAPHCDFPASSPHVLGCGGTSLRVGADGTVSSETVWNDGSTGGSTGGGVSDAFPLPSWQSTVGVPARSGSTATGRGVPDVAGDADPQTGYQVLIDGNSTVIGGTSAVAPLWAGIACRLAQLTGKPLGLLAPKLYTGAVTGNATAGLRDITEGSNGAYSAIVGWDACTGLGVPDGPALLAKLKG